MSFTLLDKFLRSLNPTIAIYTTIGITTLVRRLFPKNKSFHNFLKITLSIAFVVIVVNCSFGSYVSLIPNAFVLRLDWFRGVAFGSIERSSVPILVSILLVGVTAIRECYHLSFSLFVRSMLHIATAIGVLFATDIISVLFYLELVVIISAAITIGDRNVKRKNALSYAALHVASGTLMLVGMLAIATSTINIGGFAANENYILSVACVGLSIAISVGIPPFSFLFVDVYGATSTRNTITLVSLLSKVTIFACIPMLHHLPKSMFALFGILLIPYTFIRLMFQRSLKKIVLLSVLSHNAVLMLFMSVIDFKSDALFKTHIGIGVLNSFFAMSILRFIERYNPLILDDIRLLNSKEVKNKKTFRVAMVLLLVLISNFPTSVSYFSESSLLSIVKLPKITQYAILVIQTISVFAASKIAFSLFGIFGKLSIKGFVVKRVKKPAKFFIQDRKLDFRTMILLSTCAIICLLGSYLYSHMELIMQSDHYGFNFNAFYHYCIAFGVGLSLAFFFKKTMNPNNLKIVEEYNIMSIMTELVFGIYNVFTEIIDMVKNKLLLALSFLTKVIKITVRKSAVGEFASLYSADTVICCAVIAMSALLMLIV
ncbi:MAG: hypothetical protein JJW01_03215 [Alphaproteobacteria bacterium]|nr:hypothetical protein [Rickettsiales bacterium]